jgi:hypothetical protein
MPSRLWMLGFRAVGVLLIELPDWLVAQRRKWWG